jgi:tRNA(fMet)-specific endonuclease VapC
MKWVLDTTAFSAWMKQDTFLVTFLKQHRPRDFGTVPPVVAEIEFGLERLDKFSAKYTLLSKARDRALSILTVLPWNDEASRLFGVIKADQEKKGMLIDDLDIAIGAIALSHQCGVITANVRHFSRINGIECLSWEKT